VTQAPPIPESAPAAVAVGPAPLDHPLAIRRARLRLAVLTVVLTAVGVAAVGLLALRAQALSDGFDGLGVAEIPALATAGAALVVLMVPASLVAGAAGFSGGTVVGTVVAILATTAGAVVAAALGRWSATPSGRHAFGARVERGVTWFDARPVRSVMTARLVPGTPFNVTSYVLGFTRIPLRQIALGTAIGYAPRCFAYAAVGGSLREIGSPQATAAIIASVLLAIAVVVGPRLALGRFNPTSNTGDNGHG
jgi:uncharacterized membrane protein YdjX (TVP38/TMEM64 family)